MKTRPLGPFLGINDRLPDFALHVRTRQLVGDFLRTAVNVDVDDKGNLVRRRATVLTVNVPGAHSLSHGYYVRGGVIYTLAGTAVKTLTTDDPVSWCKVGDDLFFSNGTDSGRINAGVAHPLALPTPDQPTHTVIAGALEPGWYQMATSYARYVSGVLVEEGGVSASDNRELTATGGLRVALPTETDGATHVHIYLSAANGEVPYLLASVAVGTATYDCTALATRRESTGRFETPLPAGTLFFSNGRLCSFSGNLVYVGLPYRYGYTLTLDGFIAFPSDVTLAVENQGGTYIATTTDTYWFPGDLGDVKDTVLNPLPYGAVPGTAFKHPTDPIVGWFSSKGFVLASSQGQVEAVTQDNVDVTAPASGCSAVLEDGGYRRVVSCGYCMNLTNKAVTTYTGWEFDAVSGGLGSKSDGIYTLSSDGLVNATIGLGKQAFGSEELKLLPNVYAGFSSEAALDLTVGYIDSRGEAQSHSFPTRRCGPELQIQRFDTAKGMRSNWFDLTVSNTDGADFTLASISFAPAVTTRRI